MPKMNLQKQGLLLFLYLCLLGSGTSLSVAEPLIELTPEEHAWLAEHPVIRVGVMNAWPPMNFVDEDGTPRGIGIDYLQALNKRMNGMLKIVPQPFKHSLKAVKEKQLDALMDITPKPEREHFYNFTKPYIAIPKVIIGRRGGPVYKEERDLEGFTVALEQGFFTINRFRRDFPAIKIREYVSTADCLDAVSSGEVDAYIGNRAVAVYLIERQLISNLQITGRSTEPPVSLTIGTRKDWPELTIILNKVLASITSKEKSEIHRNWIYIKEQMRMVSDLPSEERSRLSDDLVRTAGLILFIFLLQIAVMWLLFRLAGVHVLLGARTTKKQILGVIASSLFLTTIISAVWLGLQQLEHQARTSVGESLNVIAQTSQRALHVWLQGQKEHIELIARDQKVIGFVKQLLIVPRTREQLLAGPSLHALRKHIKAIAQYQHKGFFIISPDLINIGSRRDANMVRRNLIAEKRPKLLQKAFSGETVFIPPIASDVPLTDATGQERKAPPTMFLATPVRDANGGLIAVLTLRYDPGEQLTLLCEAARTGQTGETYLFDGNGRLLTQSRFHTELTRVGIFSQAEDAFLGFRLADPGGNLMLGYRPSIPKNRQPLTRMATAATAGKSGLDVQGYRDYRGVAVLGAWLWNDEMQLGIATEIDEQEALSAYRGIRTVVLIVLFMVAVLTIILVGFVLVSGNRTYRALQKAKDEWERVAEDKTAKLRESENRFRSYFNNAPMGVAVTAPKLGWIEVNDQFCTILGYTCEELVKKTWSQIRVADDMADDRKQFQRMKAGEIESYSMDVRFNSKDGNIVYTNLSVTCTRKGDGTISHILLSMVDITLRKNTESELYTVSERLKLATQSANVGIWDLNVKENILIWDDSMYAIYGLDSKKFKGVYKGWAECLHPDDRDKAEQVLRAALRGEYDYDTLFRIVRPNGTVRHIHAIARIERDQAGAAERMIGVNWDVTEQKRTEEELKIKAQELERSNKAFEKSRRAALSLMQDAETQRKLAETALADVTRSQEALKESEKRFRDLFEKSPVAYQSLDEDGCFIDANEELIKMLGYEWEELRERSFGDFCTPESRKMFDKRFQELKSCGETGTEFTLVTKTGEELIVLINGRTQYNTQNQTIRTHCILHNITERKRAEEALREAEERSRLLLDSAGEGIFGTDVNGQATFINPAATRMLGFASEELIGQNIHDAVHHTRPDGSHYAIESCPMTKAYTAGERNHVDDEVLWRKDGSALEVAYTATPIQRNGELVGSVITFRDITDRKRAEAEIVKAREAAEEATRTKSDFLANMSHEIRTPMNAIIGLSHLALRTNLDPKQHDYLEKIDASANSLLGIINDILDFSKVEAGKLHIEHVEFDLNESLDKLANLITIKAQEKEDLEVLFHLDAKIPCFLVGDPLRLNQILVNLCNNALKFTERGEIELSTRLIEQSDRQIRVQFSVRDSGIGITEEHRSKLFQAFSQADTSTTRKYGGSGLGLTISKSLVEMMGGDIWVKSKPGAGSEFFFTTVFGLGRGKEKKPFAVSEDLHNLNTLVIDDSPTARQILVEMLEPFNLIADQASSGAKGLDLIKLANENRPYDLILMDWKMPDMDGIATGRHIRQIRGLKRQPKIILVTGYSQEEAMKEVKNAGLDGLLIKPVSPSRLFNAIMLALGRVEARRLTAEVKKHREPEMLQSLRGTRILLVEDNEINQQVAQEILEEAGILVTVANNGQEAVDWVQKTEFDAVLMDIQMPIMSGYEATREIRKEARFKDLPILAMTAGAMVQDRKKAYDAGMNDHISKPININELFSGLAKWIKPNVRKHVSDKRKIVSDQKPGQHVMDLPDTLPGVNIKVALNRIDGNQSLFRKLLEKFRTNQGRAAEEIVAALKSGERDTARRLVHTLKGLSGTIGAEKLQKAASELETAIKDQKKEFNGLIKNVADNLRTVVASIFTLSKFQVDQVEGLPAATAEKAEDAVVFPLLDELKMLLEENEIGGLHKLNQLKKVLKGTSVHDELMQLEQSLEKYDTDKALEQLAKIMKILKGT